MISFEVQNVAVFREAKRDTYVQGYHSLSFNVRGLDRLAAPGVDIREDVPFFLLKARGTTVTYAYGADRENWVVMLQSAHWRPSRKPGHVEIRFHRAWEPVPMLTRLDPAFVPKGQSEMRRLRALLMNPIPLNIARLNLGVLAMLAAILEKQAGEPRPQTPAHQLKTLLDDPNARQFPLPDLCRRTGFSPEHVRALFKEAFGISPSGYRMQSRMAEAMDRIANTDMSVKQISYALGFRHVSHFSHVFKSAFGVSPRDAILQYRMF